MAMQQAINPYRYGVLEGNHVEDRFGLDLAASEKNRKIGVSQAKDTYRWINSIKFDHRDEIYKERPHLQELEGRNHKLGYYKSTNTNHQISKCTTNPYEMNILDKGANQVSDPNVFSQYGNWVMNPNLNNTTMYQVDDAGKGREKGVPASLLFGHGLDVNNFHTRDFKSTNELAIDRHLVPQEFIRPNYRAEQTIRKEVFNQEATLPRIGKNTVGDVDSLKELRRTGQFRHYDEFTKRFDATNHNLPLRK